MIMQCSIDNKIQINDKKYIESVHYMELKKYSKENIK